ncbi:MAG: SHOCT domain-containing protein [Egibacteraceae bacterium]
MMHDTMGQWMNVWVVFWLIFGLLLIALMVTGLVWMIRNVGAGPRRSPDRKSDRDGVLHELELRYARGELDREDYLQRRADLER